MGEGENRNIDCNNIKKVSDKMNTVAKGDDFENRVYNILLDTLKNSHLKIKREGESSFWIVPSSASINKKAKKIFPWGDVVINDLTIEGENNDDFLILVECKSYNHPVDRGEVAEFNTRIRDLKATKGILITTNRFQKGALRMAEYHNIALVRVDQNNLVTWDLYRLGFYNEDSDFNDFYGLSMRSGVVVYDKNLIYKSISHYISRLLDITPHHIEQYIPYYTEEQIQRKVDLFLCNRSFDSVDDHILFFYMIYHQILINTQASCGNCLGEYNFHRNTILISKDIKDIHVKRFTIAHELGHAILHREALQGLFEKANDFNIDDFYGLSKWEKRLELQANLFASYLLIPRIPFINLAMEIKLKLGIPYDKPFFLDDQLCNIEICDKAIRALAYFFNVSKLAIKNRLINEHLLLQGNGGRRLFDYNS